MARSPSISLAPCRRRPLAWGAAFAALLAVVAAAAIGPRAAAGWALWSADVLPQPAVTAIDHLVVSEVMTGGASASDEFIELYNPSTTPLALEGLEVIYVTASGATVTRKAAWVAGEPALAPGAHLLVANEAGVFAAIADVTYVNGLAATGGSLAIRAIGASDAIDALGWGTATAWLEGRAAPAVAAGHSLERRPGGAAGSGQDGNDNAADFADRATPDPQNRAALSIPIDPSPSATPSVSSVPTPTSTGTTKVAPTADPTLMPTATLPATATLTPSATDPQPTATASPMPSPTFAPTASPTPEPAPTSPPMTVAEARALPDGSIATIEAVSLTAFDFADGGGCVADATAGIAVLVAGPSFGRGSLVAIGGELDDRFHQRTLRSDPDQVAVLGPAAEPEPIATGTGVIGETLECRLVTTTGTIVSSATQLSGAVAFDLDDGSGAARLVVPDVAGIATADWARGTLLELRGVVLQRDSSGTGSGGYRLTLRNPDDVLAIQAPTPTPSRTPGPSASPEPSNDPSIVSIEAARGAAPNSRLRVRGIVTLPTSVLGDGTAAIQDATGAIVLRLSDEAGELAIGDLVQVDGIRSTKSGMETIRVPDPPQRLGSAAAPDPARHATGALGEGHEAHLVVARGAVVTSPRRTSAQNVYFDIDDGSGPLRVFLTPGAAIDPTAVAPGAWVEIVGVLGQETTGQQPLRGYRLWPRRPGDVRSVASPSGAPGPSAATTGGSGPGPQGGAGPGSPARAGATAAPAWPPGIPAPRLAAPTNDDGTTAASATPTSDPRTTSATAPPDAPIELLLLVAAGVLGAIAAAAAARPGTLDRLRLAIVRVGDRPTGGESPAVGGAAPADAAASSSPVEAAIAGLVPLRVVGEPSVPEDAPSVASRSVRRILPPT